MHRQLQTCSYLTFGQGHNRDWVVRVDLWVLAGMLEAVRTGQVEAHHIGQAEVLDHTDQAGDREEPQIGCHAEADDPWEDIVREEALEEGVLHIVGRILAELRSLLLIIQHFSSCTITTYEGELHSAAGAVQAEVGRNLVEL
jgi:hypothetical protein